ncbi:fluoride efflux transporter CrcB [Marinobacter lutaoensis]|jgi:CrcB protein|uniref:Fluoride-specific ion channel FluC n=1 Tax=Marinobacter lutaoensis TaxID=135739 RepID=A0A1V2DSL1_9GAMM|nr:fluoride efflux transporter CrcB [Marinobacter lutaoensis]NVD35846.1 fluoride efflux transporter CrcB [Marinobacter lutaoensis]ONF43529.1 fluoride ion transporter CrcB [Marinobacter lutaoensis]|tara:strand:- start:3654 stop:4034 length:381 start_codon:yes stop_codon:yes gene_type:complete
MWLSVVAVSLGAVVGANLRWGLGLWLNSTYHAIPIGTLVANLAGGWLIGLLMAYFTHGSSLAPEWRLFAVTGLCGALTTFSTFSLEMFSALQEGKWAMALAGILAHVLGSLLMTALGFCSFSLLKG